MTELDPGGAERALVQLATGLDRRAWDPLVISLAAGGALVEPLSRAGVPVRCLNARRARQLSVLPRLVGELRRWRPALLQTWLYHANLAGRIAGQIARVPRIVSGIRVAERRSRWRLRADRATEWLVDHHVCVSRDVAEFSITEGRLTPSKVSVIPNGVDAEVLSSAAPFDWTMVGIPAGAPVMLFVGRLDPQKDPLTAFETAIALRESHPGLHTVFVGEGPLRKELEDRIRNKGAEASIHILGWRPDVPNLLRGAAVLVLPSRWEGMPNVVLEAMAAGTPVVATQVEGLREVIESGVTDWLVPVGSVPDLAAAVKRILDAPGQAAVVAHKAQVAIREKFTISAAVQRYEALYRQLLAQVR